MALKLRVQIRLLPLVCTHTIIRDYVLVSNFYLSHVWANTIILVKKIYCSCRRQIMDIKDNWICLEGPQMSILEHTLLQMEKW